MKSQSLVIVNAFTDICNIFLRLLLLKSTVLDILQWQSSQSDITELWIYPLLKGPFI